MTISFGDRVRVLATSATTERGLAGLIGEVRGVTTPSVTGVEVIGQTEDYGLNVAFDGDEKTYWFADELLELVDHSPGLEIAIGENRWVRLTNGEWEEVKKSSGFSIWKWFRFRFSLRGLLLTVTLAALFMAWFGWLFRRSQQAIHQAEQAREAAAKASAAAHP